MVGSTGGEFDGGRRFEEKDGRNPNLELISNSIHLPLTTFLGLLRTMASTPRTKHVPSEEDNLVKGRTKRSTAGNRVSSRPSLLPVRFADLLPLPLCFQMRALLDSELEADTGFEEVEDDVDFVAKGSTSRPLLRHVLCASSPLPSSLLLRPSIEEEDAFDNDFASTDEEEGADDAEDAGERTLRYEEKQARKVSSTFPSFLSPPSRYRLSQTQ